MFVSLDTSRTSEKAPAYAGSTVDELSELLGTDFAREDVTTVGGLVYELFGRVPHNGESVVSGGYRIVVERVRRRRIERVYFERLETVGSRSDA